MTALSTGRPGRQGPRLASASVRAVARRLGHLVPVLVLVSLGTMLLADLVPGDAARTIAGDGATSEQIVAIRHRLGLDQPFHERYVSWLGRIARGDFGRSALTGVPVFDSIRDRLPVTLQIAVMSIVMAVLLAVPAALYAAYRQGRIFDRVASGVSSLLISSPAFLTGLVLVYALSLKQRVFPVTGWVRLTDDPWQNLRHAFLPAFTLALAETPVFFRLLRSDTVATLQEDYIMAARAKGMSTVHVLLRHALRPSSLSLVTVLGLSLGRTIGGTVIVESLFALPGLGQLVVDSVFNSDLSVVQGVVMFVALCYVFINLVVDLLYARLDPRVRGERS